MKEALTKSNYNSFSTACKTQALAPISPGCSDKSTVEVKGDSQCGSFDGRVSMAGRSVINGTGTQVGSPGK